MVTVALAAAPVSRRGQPLKKADMAINPIKNRQKVILFI